MDGKAFVMVVRSVLLGSVFVGCGAVSACPVAGDLTAGIAVTFSDGLTEVYRRSGGADVQVEGVDGAIVTHRLDLLQGVYLQRYIAVEDGEEVPASASVYTYPEGAEAPVLPVVGETWEGDVTLTEGGEARVEVQSHVVDVPQEMVFGACTYTIIPVTITYGEDAAYVEVVNFLPELGFGYLAAYAVQGRDMNEQAVTMIEVLAP